MTFGKEDGMAIDPAKMPKLGFGAMRLPSSGGKIDIEAVKRMVDLYMSSGLNYFDTSIVYHGGKSETALKEALVERYPRESFTLADKLPAWEMHCREDVERLFNKELENLGTDYLDYLLLHSIEEGGNYNNYIKYDCFEFGKRMVREGKAKHFGFSFHGSPELLEKIVDEHPEAEFVQIQLNYADWDNPVVQSGRLYEILHKRNIPMIIMEPVKGGSLANMPEDQAQILLNEEPDRSLASWALRYVASLPGVMTVLSGMSDEEQMKDNLATFTDFKPLTEHEKEVIQVLVAKMHDVPTIGCTSCRYCTDGCPAHISIPDIIRCINTTIMYPDDKFRVNCYYGDIIHLEGNGKASDCYKCGKCENVCPQHLPIRELMDRAAERFDSIVR